MIDHQAENEAARIHDDDALVLLDVGRHLAFEVVQAGDDRRRGRR